MAVVSITTLALIAGLSFAVGLIVVVLAALTFTGRERMLAAGAAIGSVLAFSVSGIMLWTLTEIWKIA